MRFIFSVLATSCDSFASASLFLFLPFLLIKRDINPILLGSFTAIFFIGNFSGKAILGRFVDKRGSAKVFIISELLMALFIFLLANSMFLPVIIICLLVLGVFTKGTVPVVQTMVTESVEHHGSYEKAFSINSVVANTAITSAPILLGIISDRFGIVSAFNVMAVAALVATLPALGFLFSPKAVQKG